ncbi:MSHA biogenesis protein MshF [Shewanella sp. NIFS-20-20]|uniref:MSHA biogenesis protein MshF n=1 Tax=Shewanella sp. NIFS-20-20 TaxID=2853806 RepID=UPI001C45324C|nr:MSHA biogenesis protein MshF [Shewanella sp. NIFS-20-20]MBV7317383.1 MSHA biogenesis protein MshF [Shewanella sp. NIFS-20-20]
MGSSQSKPQPEQSNLVVAYKRLVTLILILLLLGIIGIRYFDILPQMSGKGLQLEHPRFINVLAMVKAQWLSVNRPQQLSLNWVVTAGDDSHPAPVVVTMDAGGWPLPQSRNNQGCQLLWWQLLGSHLDSEDLVVVYVSDSRLCRYQSVSGEAILYHLDSGGVNFLTKGH